MINLNQSVVLSHQTYKIYRKSLSRIISSVIDHNINNFKYSTLTGSCNMKLPKELNHPRKDLINIQNTDDNGCFKLCLILTSQKLSHSRNFKI